MAASCHDAAAQLPLNQLDGAELRIKHVSRCIAERLPPRIEAQSF